MAVLRNFGIITALKNCWISVIKQNVLLTSKNSVIRYLGRYTHRIAISNRRIINMNEKSVTYSVKDYKNEGKWTTVMVLDIEFIHQFLMHVLPKGFVRIRYYGLLSYRMKKQKMTLCRNLLGCKQYISILRGVNTEQMMLALYNVDSCKYPECGGYMVPYNHHDYHRRESASESIYFSASGNRGLFVILKINTGRYQFAF